MHERPGLITAVCVLGFIVFGLSLLSAPMIFGAVSERYGVWYGPVWAVSIALTIVSLVGYWRMKKWGVRLYAGLFVFGILLSLFAGIPFSVPGFLVPLAITSLGFANYKRMD
jgi:hypothetical protein